MAMKSLQRLILGSPHNISKASVLLGLLSWHIYPDLNVVDPTADIPFHDPLVQVGGVVTLGLQRADSLGDGVHWSLSLSHLRYYGSPVAVERSIGSVGSDDGRLTLPELHLVALYQAGVTLPTLVWSLLLIVWLHLGNALRCQIIYTPLPIIMVLPVI